MNRYVLILMSFDFTVPTSANRGLTSQGKFAYNPVYLNNLASSQHRYSIAKALSSLTRFKPLSFRNHFSMIGYPNA